MINENLRWKHLVRAYAQVCGDQIENIQRLQKRGADRALTQRLIDQMF